MLLGAVLLIAASSAQVWKSAAEAFAKTADTAGECRVSEVPPWPVECQAPVID